MAEPEPTGGDKSAELRARYGVTVVLAGLIVVLIAFVVAVVVFNDAASDVSTAVGTITGVIGTIVGAYFGVQVGASGKEEAEAARGTAEDQAKALAAVAPAAPAAAILGYEPETLNLTAEHPSPSGQPPGTGRPPDPSAGR